MQRRASSLRHLEQRHQHSGDLRSADDGATRHALLAGSNRYVSQSRRARGCRPSSHRECLAGVPDHPVADRWSPGLPGRSGMTHSRGTSFAAPHVAGLAALLVAQLGQGNPALIRARILQSADDLGEPGTDPYYGKGRINVARGTGNHSLSGRTE